MEQTYSIMAINPGHNGSAALVIDGEVIFYGEEERFSRSKYDGNPFRAMLHILSNVKVDELVLGGTTSQFAQLPWTGENAYVALARKFNPNIKVTNLGDLHHLGHAASAFYNSGFESAAALVVDGSGSFHQEQVGNNEADRIGGFETETIYQCGYPHDFNAVYKRYSDGNSVHYDNGIQLFDGSVTITKAYEAVSHYLGFGFIEAGKTMGLAPYGSVDPNIPPFFINGRGNKNLLIPKYPAGALIDEDRFPYLKRFAAPQTWHNDFSLVRDIDKNIAYHVQAETENLMMQLIQRAVDITGETNIVLSGGFALNCVANYKYLKQFPNLKFYIDPIAHDGGTAIGLARYAWYQHTKNMQAKSIPNVYLSINPDYSQLAQLEKQVPSIKVTDISVSEVAALLADQKIIALFQGRSEGGPRALGNRSLLFDPRPRDGKDIVNRVKRREWFRPFAASVIEENVSEWFDLAGLSSSPYMMYAVDVLPHRLEQVPAISHVDGTCRIQTVNSQDNANFYQLIKEFYNLTQVPMLLNTSFNLAGQPLVETIVDAIVTLISSDIDCLYLPELGKLVTKAQ